jgi:hypothetical protein
VVDPDGDIEGEVKLSIVQPKKQKHPVGVGAGETGSEEPGPVDAEADAETPGEQ